MNTATHTPTPWIAGGLSDKHFGSKANGFLGEANSIADAAFIVRACNVHGVAVKLLRALREDCRGIHETDQDTGETWSDQIDAVLAKAAA